MRYLIALLMLVSANPVLAQAGDTFDWQRARENYMALVEGRKQLRDLTALELQELQEFRRRLQEKPADQRSARERCEDTQIERLGSKKITYLDRRHIDLVCRDEPD